MVVLQLHHLTSFFFICTDLAPIYFVLCFSVVVWQYYLKSSGRKDNVFILVVVRYRKSLRRKASDAVHLGCTAATAARKPTGPDTRSSVSILV